jgi:hypothetical protein
MPAVLSTPKKQYATSTALITTRDPAFLDELQSIITDPLLQTMLRVVLAPQAIREQFPVHEVETRVNAQGT